MARGYDGEERRANDGLEERVSELEASMVTLHAEVRENTRITKSVEDNTAAIIEGFNALAGARKVVRWVGGTVVWLSVIVIALGILYYFLKTGELPRKP